MIERPASGPGRSSVRPRPQEWLVRLGAFAGIVLPLVTIAVEALSGWPAGGSHLAYLPVVLAFVGVGWLLCERRPGNAVGSLLLTFGALFGLFLPFDLYLASDPAGLAATLSAIYLSSLDVPLFTLLALTLVVFPDGRPLSPRWRITYVVAAFASGLAVGGYLISSAPIPIYPSYTSPVGIPDVDGLLLVESAYVVMLCLLIAGAASLFLRWHRGSQTVRAQVKWVVGAAIIAAGSELLNVATFDPAEPNSPTAIASSVAIGLVPLSIGIAVLRYRLYEIDRIISRTIVLGDRHRGPGTHVHRRASWGFRRSWPPSPPGIPWRWQPRPSSCSASSSRSDAGSRRPWIGASTGPRSTPSTPSKHWRHGSATTSTSARCDPR